MSDSRQLYDDDHNMDGVRRDMQSGLQRGIDNLFNRVRQLEIVDVKRKRDLEQHISADREHLLHNLSLSEDLRIWLETIDARLAALEDATKDLQYAWQATADMELRNETRIAAIEANASVAANCAPTSAPTKRQQVAERFLDAAVGEFGYLAAADWLYQSASHAQSKDPDAYERMVKMARLLEEAAREDQPTHQISTNQTTSTRRGSAATAALARRRGWR